MTDSIREPWLDIAIPTFNRLDVLKEHIGDLLFQAKETGALVSFYDNASSDGSESFLRSIADKYPFVHYHRNDVNIGLDRNMLLGISNARAPYVFWLGDDDTLAPGALIKIRHILDELKPELILLKMSGAAANRHTMHDQDVVYRNPVSFFTDHVFDMPFGTTIMKADFARFIPQCERFIGTFHAYSGLITEALAEKFALGETCLISVTAEQMVSSLQVPKSWLADQSSVYLSGIGKWFDELHCLYSEAKIIRKQEFLQSAGYIRTLDLPEAIALAPEAVISKLKERLANLEAELASMKEYSLSLEENLDSSRSKLSAKRAELAALKTHVALLSSRLSSLVNRWTRLGWRLMPWTKPEWRHNPTKKK